MYLTKCQTTPSKLKHEMKMLKIMCCQSSFQLHELQLQSVLKLEKINQYKKNICLGIQAVTRHDRIMCNKTPLLIANNPVLVYKDYRIFIFPVKTLAQIFFLFFFTTVSTFIYVLIYLYRLCSKILIQQDEIVTKFPAYS